jgi:plastocyanin
MKACALFVAFTVAAGACGGDDELQRDAAVSDGLHDSLAIDAPPDAAQFVMEVSCTGSELTIVTENNMFDYIPMMRTIDQNDVLRFDMSSTHNVVPTASGSDPGLVVGFSQTKCLKFTATGVFTFRCTSHDFVGTVTVN